VFLGDNLWRAARSKQITKAVAILTELAISLDHRSGGDPSRLPTPTTE
jgi:flagellin-specific chaperone FliS